MVCFENWAKINLVRLPPLLLSACGTVGWLPMCRASVNQSLLNADQALTCLWTLLAFNIIELGKYY